MKEILSRDDGSLRILTLNSPPGNALTLRSLRTLEKLVKDAGAATAVRALLIESNVENYFSSGLDIGEVSSRKGNSRLLPFDALVDAYRTLLDCPKPTVAILNGSALLGGWIVAMACDWRLATPESDVSLSEIRLGLSPTAGFIARLRALSSDSRLVKEMLLRGRRVGADAALAAGLIDEVHRREELPGAALALARRLAKSPPRAYASIKRELNAVHSGDSIWKGSLREFKKMFSGAEAREGLCAAAMKRRPRWEAA